MLMFTLADSHFIRVPEGCLAFSRAGTLNNYDKSMSDDNWSDYVRDMASLVRNGGIARTKTYSEYFGYNAGRRFCDVCAPGEVEKLRKRLVDIHEEMTRIGGVLT